MPQGLARPKNVPGGPMGVPAGADAVFGGGGAVLGYWNDELGGESCGLFVFVGGSEHLPIAADGFVDLDGDGRVFVVAQSDFKFHFPGVGVNALVVGLFVLGDDVES